MTTTNWTDLPPDEIRAYLEDLIEAEMERRNPGWRQRAEEERRIQRLHAEICNYTGAKFDPEMDIAEIARHVRREMKERLPHLGASVRIARFAGGTSLKVNVMSDATDDEMDDIVEIVEAYNFDRSGYNNDYCHNNFFQSITRQGIEGLWGRRSRQTTREWSRVIGRGYTMPEEAEDDPPNWAKEGF